MTWQIVSHRSKVKFLGYTFGKCNKEDKYKPRLHNKSKVKIKDKIRGVTPRNHFWEKEEWITKTKQVIRGWVNYYYLAEMKTFLMELDQWFRRRIRMVFLKRWKKCKTKMKNLMKLGLDSDSAKRIGYSRKGYWHLSKTTEMHWAISNKRLESIGFIFFLTLYNEKNGISWLVWKPPCTERYARWCERAVGGKAPTSLLDFMP